MNRIVRCLKFCIPLLAAAATASFGLKSATSAEPFWRQVVARKKVEADPNADYTLAETNGPWLIMAASFNGEAGEDEARELVRELRSKFNLAAFYYGMTFQLEDERPGRGLDHYGSRIKRRYQRGSQVLEHAVLVGEFPSIDDPEAQGLLDRVKTLDPDCLKVEVGEPTSQSLVSIRQMQRAVKQRLGKPVNRGPMGHAFLTRNPLLPKEYFTPRVDAEVAKWNENFEYSLLKCPGKFTIKVATFSGRSTLSGTEDAEAGARSRRAKEDDPLVLAGDNAHKLAVALRSRGWEAYEFHDRSESYVTIGSFDEMEKLPDGRLVPSSREAQVIVNTFGAASPNVSLEKPAYREMGVKEEAASAIESKEERIKREFNNRFKGLGDVAEGFHPKRFVGVPFDIQPVPIEAPKVSISSAYVRR